MTEPLFWLGLSILLVAVSLTAVLMAALPAFQELAHAARSAEKLFDTLNRELPPTLEAIRLTGIELTNLTDDVGQNVQAAGRVVGQLDQRITGIKRQAQQAQVTTRSMVVGLKAAWQTFRRADTSAPTANPPRSTAPPFSAATAYSLDENTFAEAMFDDRDDFSEGAFDTEITAPLHPQEPCSQPEPTSSPLPKAGL